MTELLLFLGAGYTGIGLLCAVRYAKAERRAFATLIADPAAAAGSALRLTVELAKLPAWRRWCLAVLRFLVAWTAWPVYEVFQPRDRRRRPDPWEPTFRDPRWPGSAEELTAEYASRTIRRTSLVTAALSVFLVITAGAFVSAPEDAVQVTLLVWFVLLGAAARQGQDLLADKFVSTVARRSGLPLPYAYRDVLVAAAADLVTLSVCGVLLLDWVPGGSLRFDWFSEQLLAVVKGVHVTDLRQSVTESPSAVLVGLTSIAFYASVIVPIKNILLLRRSGDELVAAAESALRHGRPERARRLFDEGRSKEGKSKPDDQAVGRVGGLLALSEGRVSGAREAAERLVRHYRIEQRLDQLREREDGLFVMLHWCRGLEIAPPSDFVELARDVPVRDSMMASLLANNADILYADAEGGGRGAALASVLDPDAWPLAFCVVYTLDGDQAAAARILPGADRVTGLDLLWRNQLARGQEGFPADEEAVAAKVCRDAEALLAEAADCDITTWPEWHRTAFARMLSVPLIMHTRYPLDDDLASALVDLRQRVAGEFAEDAELAVLRNMATGPPNR